MDRVLRFIFAVVLAGMISMPASGDESTRLPKLSRTSGGREGAVGHSNQALTISLRPGLTINDSYTVALPDGVPSYIIGIESDSTVFLKTTMHSGLDTEAWEILGGQYWLDPNPYFNGDTLVFLCKTCPSAGPATTKLRIFRGEEIRNR